jgi:hypothetical protein
MDKKETETSTRLSKRKVEQHENIVRCALTDTIVGITYHSRANNWILPASRPSSPTEQLNILLRLHAEESRRFPEPKQDELQVDSSYLNN